MLKLKKNLLLPLFILFGFSGIAHAEQAYNSPAGDVKIVVRDNQKYLSVGAEIFDLGWQSLLTISQPSDAIAENFPHHYLIYQWGGGSICYGFFRWLNASKTPPQLTDSFGTCNDSYDNMRLEGDAIVFELHGNGSEGRVSFIYDGVTVTERNAGLRSVDSVSNPYNPDDWVGVHPWSYLSAPENEAFLVELLGWDLLNSLRFYSVGNEFKQDGQWIVGQLCQGSHCTTNKLILLISRETAVPVIAYKSWDHPDKWKFIGDVPADLPNSVRGFLAKG